ncbi:hypothetical protein CEP54_009121 [Fusarium duplospermum]|uniref:AAA+ ATPase domain-containing protein n=1 Tax=Fusarium duplospermum TaxID=1325734 RepID=A0A428PS83_9HYPO|nr:hypothetical protein CEP54_009121 [Fusarium duplospermum]
MAMEMEATERETVEASIQSTMAPASSETDDQAAATHPPKLTNEIHILKAKILELEKRSEAPPEPPAHLPPLSSEMEQYRRMEKCLYRHRKEWQASHSMQEFGMGPETRDIGAKFGFPAGPWDFHWGIDNRRETEYNRPDPFNPHHQCGDEEALGDEDNIDEYDHAIDFGSRRDRLRKNFEWEMDRLYLVEETDIRRRQRLEEEKRLREQTSNPEHQGSENGENGKEDTAVTVSNVRQYAKPVINRIEWLEFKALATVPEEHACAVDILIGDPIIEDKSAVASWWFGYLHRQSRKPQKAPVRKTVISAPGQAQLPERIRVHSNALLTILDKIFGSEGSRVMADEGSPIVFLRPFKALVYCEQALREWCAMLADKFNKDPEGDTRGGTGEQKTPDSSEPKTQEIASNGTSSKENDKTNDQQHHKVEGQQDDDDTEEEEDDPNDITRSETALDHLKCLLTFFDEDIAKKRAHLSEGDNHSVFFSDLWHLFRPGTEVIRNDGKQAYRVLHVATAKHRRVLGYQAVYDLPDRKKEKSKPDLSVICVYIDFNGKHMGPVLKTFDFKRFEGERQVRSLEVYPLRYHPISVGDFGEREWKDLEEYPEADRFRQQLVRRGAMFLKVAAVRHMYYSGPTLEVREEVESQVVVDFETAFSIEEESHDLFPKPELEVLVDNDFLGEEEEGDSDYCYTCCRDDIVYNDAHVDRKQTEEYIDRLLPGKDLEPPSIAFVPRPLKELQSAEPGHPAAVSDEELLIMSHRVYGFILRSRKWGERSFHRVDVDMFDANGTAKLDLAFLTDIRSSNTSNKDNSSSTVDGKETEETDAGQATAFDRLVLPKGHKSMILSLIAQHFRDKESKGAQVEQVDIVRGKGKGLILLLHGAPGVGKTSTAEGVAELFKKPLFQITCDLGTTAKEVEAALETNFALANRWGCILLLDEADVFLAERSKDDFTRNGLYYAGILFLTTNRVGDFDEAFRSRIHISLYYPELDQSNTVKVFTINMEMIEERFSRQGRRIKIDKVGIGSFAQEHFTNYGYAKWNGRQIRNACQTALALAEFEAQGKSHIAILEPNATVELTVAHFTTVRDAYLEFTKYMIGVYGSTDARKAKEGKIRAWLDENRKVVGTEASRAAFVQASQGPLYKGAREARQYGRTPQYGSAEQIPSQPQPHHQVTYESLQQQGGYQSQWQQNFHAPDIQPRQSPQPPYDESSRAAMQTQSFHAGSSQPTTHAQFLDPSQSQIPRGHTSHEQQRQSNYPAWQNQGMQSNPAPSGQQGPVQLPPGMIPKPGAGGGFGPV